MDTGMALAFLVLPGFFLGYAAWRRLQAILERPWNPSSVQDCVRELVDRGGLDPETVRRIRARAALDLLSFGRGAARLIRKLGPALVLHEAGHALRRGGGPRVPMARSASRGGSALTMYGQILILVALGCLPFSKEWATAILQWASLQYAAGVVLVCIGWPADRRAARRVVELLRERGARDLREVERSLEALRLVPLASSVAVIGGLVDFVADLFGPPDGRGDMDRRQPA